MDEMNAFTTMIGSVGFPIAACCAMFYLYNKQLTLLNELKVVMTKLLAKLDADEIEVE